MIDFFRKHNRRKATGQDAEEGHLLIPICSCCQRIQDDEQSWRQAEVHLKEVSPANFSHGLCPACYEDQRAAFRKIKPQRVRLSAMNEENRV